MTGASADQEPTPDAATIELVLVFARTGHAAGYPTADLEARLVALAARLGLLDAQVAATPTLVEISLGTLPDQRTYTLRVRPRAADLGAIAELDALIDKLLAGSCDAPTALRQLADIEARPTRRPVPLLLGAYALAGASLTPVLGGGWREAVAGAGAGLVAGGAALPAQRALREETLMAPLAAIAASFTAAVLVEAGFQAQFEDVTLAALVTFLPGMALTIGMRELSSEHLQSGVANMALALAQLLGLVFGVGVGRSLAASWFGLPPVVAPHVSFSAVPELIGAVGAGLAFTVTLRARARDAALMCSATVLALVANEAGASLFGREAGVFVAAAVIGTVGGLVGARLHRASLVFIVPGVLMLVPGSSGFTSVLQLLSDQTISGITTAFDTFVTALAIAYGLAFSLLLLPRRVTDIARPPEEPRSPAAGDPG